MSCPYAFSNFQRKDQSSTTTSTSTSTSTNDHSRDNHHQASPIPSSPPHPSFIPNDTSSTSTSTITSTTTSNKLTAIQALQLAKSSCPAFQSSCPFRNVQDAYSMRKALENMPSSHYEVTPSSIVSTTSGSSSGSTTSASASLTNKTITTNHDLKEHDGDDNNDSDNHGIPKNIEISESLRVALQHVHDISESIRSLDDEPSHPQPPVVHHPYHNHHNHQQHRRDSMSSSIASNNTTSEGIRSSFRHTNRYSITGGICPFKTMNPRMMDNHEEDGMKFVNAMEKYSFGATIAKLIHEVEEENMQQRWIGEEEEEEEVVEKKKHAITTNTGMEQHEPAPSGSLLSSTKTLKKSTSCTSLSQALKVGTAKSHESAESVHFVKEFIKGNIDRTLYSMLVANLYWVYKTLESELERYAPDEFPTLHKPELYRTKSLQDDLEFFYTGLDFDDVVDDEDGDEIVRRKIPPSQATKDYISRLEFIAKTEPLLLLSHAYTRYLGDLSGGKVLARVAKRALNLKGNDNSQGVCDGLAFYHFEKIESAKKFKDEYRHALDNLNDLSDNQIERLVAEANVAFVLNMRIFEELDVLAEVKGVSVRDYTKATFYYDECIQGQKDREAGIGPLASEKNFFVTNRERSEEFECPFAKYGGPNPHRHHVSANPSKRCPWPFVFMHDSRLKDWQTWFLIGLFLCAVFNIFS